MSTLLQYAIAFICAFSLLHFYACDAAGENSQLSGVPVVSTPDGTSEAVLQSGAVSEKSSDKEMNQKLKERLQNLEVEATEKNMNSHNLLISSMATSYRIFYGVTELQTALDLLFRSRLVKDETFKAIAEKPDEKSSKDVINNLNEAYKIAVRNNNFLAKAIAEGETRQYGDNKLEYMVMNATKMWRSSEELRKILMAQRDQRLNLGASREPQQDMDYFVQKMAHHILEKPNIFLLLQKSKQLLEQASKLRDVIQEYRHTKKNIPKIIKKLEEMDKKIVLEQEKAEKRENHSGAGHHLPSVLDADFWTFIRQLLEDYYELDLPLMDEVKIRGSNENHPIISVGQIEYYYDKFYEEVQARRRKFPELKDEYTSKYSPAKAVPLAHTGLVSLEKADSVFFQMVQNGWDGRSYNWEGKDPHTSATFVWEFMCRLFEECPSGNALPNIFLSYTRIQKIMEKRFFTPLEDDPKADCVLEEHEIQLQIDAVQMEMSGIRIELPPIIEYTTGKYHLIRSLSRLFSIQVQAEESFPADAEDNSDSPNKKVQMQSTKAAAVQAEESFSADAEDKSDSRNKNVQMQSTKAAAMRKFKAKLTAYDCKNGSISYIQDIRVFDQIQDSILFTRKDQDRKMQLANGKGKGLSHVDLTKDKEFYLKIVPKKY